MSHGACDGGVLDVSHMLYQWVQAHKQDGLISRAADTSGFVFYSDSDWAGFTPNLKT